MISQIATLHLPYKTSYENLLKSGLNKNIYISGNTVVDALSLVPNSIIGTLLVELISIKKNIYSQLFTEEKLGPYRRHCKRHLKFPSKK